MPGIWSQVTKAFRELNPEELVREADRALSLALVAGTSEELSRMEAFFAPTSLGRHKAEQVRQRLFPFLYPLRPSQEQMLRDFDLVVCSPGVTEGVGPLSPYVYIFGRVDSRDFVKEILRDRWDLALPLAKNFLPFRGPAQQRWIHSIAFESALFAMMTAVPNILPTPFSLPWAATEFASSTVFLTANQMRLAFIIAASSDSAVGFREQKGQLTAIAAAALGWRSLARELAGKIPAGRGLLSKGLMAYAGTYVTGVTLEQLHALGRTLTREEKRQAFEDAYRAGRAVLDKALKARGSPAHTAA
ncbi:MAG: hypothetical protein IH935_04035 [Acidobacteria bacterium]|nr:hypothetical protein [Acidobacteriota bacterium]MCZ6489152.1 hypothetical protein [Acidobacteriota bacterium]MCZ6750939.1 hypothetical protein [Acidobacteriota bacterium]